MYYDQIDMLDDLPEFEEIESVGFKDDWFSLKLKTGEIRPIFMIVESITKQEFDHIARYLFKRIKNGSMFC